MAFKRRKDIMKKALLCGLSAVVLLSLTACGTAQANQPDEPSPTPSAVQTEPPQESPAITPAPENTVEPLSAVQEPTGEVSKDELQKLFEKAYENGQVYSELGVEGEDLIIMELGDVQFIFDARTDIKAPADLEAQYRAWRAEAHPDAPAVQAPAVQAPAVQAPAVQAPAVQAPAETQPQQQPSGGNTVQDNSGGTIGFDFDAHTVDSSQFQKTTDAGYKPEDPSYYIYGD